MNGVGNPSGRPCARPWKQPVGDPITLHVLTAKLLCINNKVALLKGPIFPHCLREEQRAAVMDGGDTGRAGGGMQRGKRDTVWGTLPLLCAGLQGCVLRQCVLQRLTRHGCSVVCFDAVCAGCNTSCRCAACCSSCIVCSDSAVAVGMAGGGSWGSSSMKGSWREGCAGLQPPVCECLAKRVQTPGFMLAQSPGNNRH